MSRIHGWLNRSGLLSCEHFSNANVNVNLRICSGNVNIQWLTSCHNNVMTTRVLTLSAGTSNVMSTSVTTMHFSLKKCPLLREKSMW